MSDETTFKPDHRGIGELMRGPEMRGMVELVAHEAVPFAKSISPDAPPYGEGYIADFGVRGLRTEMIAGTRRAAADLVNTSDHALIVEVGIDGRQRGHHVLSRTIDFIERG